MSESVNRIADAAARGQVRLFRQQVTKSALEICRVAAEYDTHILVHAFFNKKGVGRQRALEQLKRRFTGVKWSPVKDMILGVYLAPSTPVIVEARDPGHLQHSITARYMLITSETHYNGLWTLEVPDHALGRIVERSPNANLSEVMLSAHQEVLLLDLHATIAMVKKSILLATTNGALLSEIILGPDQSLDNEITFFIRARTWLHNDQLHENQQVVKHGSPSLGETVLLPPPLRKLNYRNGELSISRNHNFR